MPAVAPAEGSDRFPTCQVRISNFASPPPPPRPISMSDTPTTYVRNCPNMCQKHMSG